MAFVTGASGGLGYATALELAREGCRVAIASRSRERIEEAADQLATEAGADRSDLLPIVCDVTDEAHIREAVDEVVERFGPINILITNAGGPPSGYLADFDADDWRKAIELNLISTVNLVRHSLPSIRTAAKESGHARIIMISSASAKQPIPDLYLSNAARAGVQGFAKSLAEEIGPEGITVNTVLPGYTKTDRLSDLSAAVSARTGQDQAEIEEGWTRHNALRRLGKPSEFAATVTFLASKQAGYITGCAIPVDGGRSKHLL